MDPVTLGATVAAVVAAKAAEAVGKKAGEAGWGAVAGLVSKVRDWFGDREDAKALKTLQVVEQYPETQRAVDELAEWVRVAAEDDREGAAAIEAELVQIGQVEQIGDRPISQIINQARDNARVGNQYAVGGDLNITSSTVEGGVDGS